MKHLKFIILCAAVIALWVCGGCRSAETMPSAEKDVFAMDTYMTLKAYGNSAQTAVSAAADEIQRLEKLLNVNDPDSDICRLNHANGQQIEVSEDTAHLLQTALSFCEQTEGALDITIYPVLRAWGFTGDHCQIPDSTALKKLLSLVDYRNVQLHDTTVVLPEHSEVDLGAVAKGYTSDRVCQLFRQSGVSHALVNLGGNVQAVGTKPDGTLWRVGIENPKGGEPLAVVSVRDCAVITSGNYERYFVGEDGRHYHHIIDPATGFPAEKGLVSVTVIGESGVVCDALSTALFVMGKEKAISCCLARSDIEAVLIDDNNTLTITEGLSGILEPSEGCTVNILKRGVS